MSDQFAPLHHDLTNTSAPDTLATFNAARQTHNALPTEPLANLSSPEENKPGSSTPPQPDPSQVGTVYRVFYTIRALHILAQAACLSVLAVSLITILKNPQSILLLLLIGYVVEALAEIPTGQYADKYGRRKAIIAYAVCFLTAACFYAIPFLLYNKSHPKSHPPLATQFILAGVGQLFRSIGASFLSGSLEAWAVDSIKFHAGAKAEFRNLFTSASWIVNLMWLVGGIVPVVLGKVHQQIPWAWPLIAVLMLAVIVTTFLWVREPYRPTQQNLPSFEPNVVQESAGQTDVASKPKSAAEGEVSGSVEGVWVLFTNVLRRQPAKLKQSMVAGMSSIRSRPKLRWSLLCHLLLVDKQTKKDITEQIDQTPNIGLLTVAYGMGYCLWLPVADLWKLTYLNFKGDPKTGGHESILSILTFNENSAWTAFCVARLFGSALATITRKSSLFGKPGLVGATLLNTLPIAVAGWLAWASKTPSIWQINVFLLLLMLAKVGEEAIKPMRSSLLNEAIPNSKHRAIFNSLGSFLGALWAALFMLAAIALSQGYKRIYGNKFANTQYYSLYGAVLFWCALFSAGAAVFYMLYRKHKGNPPESPSKAKTVLWVGGAYLLACILATSSFAIGSDMNWFTTQELKNSTLFVQHWKTPKTPFDNDLVNTIPLKNRSLLDQLHQYDGHSEPSEPLKSLLIRELNRQIQKPDRHLEGSLASTRGMVEKDVNEKVFDSLPRQVRLRLLIQQYYNKSPGKKVIELGPKMSSVLESSIVALWLLILFVGLPITRQWPLLANDSDRVKKTDLSSLPSDHVTEGEQKIQVLNAIATYATAEEGRKSQINAVLACYQKRLADLEDQQLNRIATASLFVLPILLCLVMAVYIGCKIIYLQNIEMYNETYHGLFTEYEYLGWLAVASLILYVPMYLSVVYRQHLSANTRTWLVTAWPATIFVAYTMLLLAQWHQRIYKLLTPRDNAWDLHLSISQTAGLCSALAVAIGVFLYTAFLFSIARKRSHLYPDAVVTDGLLSILNRLKDPQHLWADGETRRHLATQVEFIACTMQYDLAHRFRSGDPFTDQWMTQMTERMALRLRATKQGLLTPRADTRQWFEQRIGETLIHLLTGEWDSLQEGANRPATPPLRQLTSFLKTLFIAILPGITLLIVHKYDSTADLPPLLLAGAAVWASLTLIAQLDPTAGAKVAAFKDVLSLFPLSGSGKK